MNGELVAAGEARIVIPTVFRDSYISALKAMSLNGSPDPLTRVLDYAQRWTSAIDWTSIETTKLELVNCNAFLDPDAVANGGVRLFMPGVRA